MVDEDHLTASKPAASEARTPASAASSGRPDSGVGAHLERPHQGTASTITCLVRPASVRDTGAGYEKPGRPRPAPVSGNVGDASLRWTGRGRTLAAPTPRRTEDHT